ncbi:TetR/AcrR family transcriptional regulator [Agromyces laixinhei]|nr:TetR/AcrR family transcriptional regulator [Agromyces laixinhei]
MRDETRRRQLMDAALELYGTIGYRATTVQAVCKSAGVSSRSFYELYPDQEMLLTELYRALNDEVLSGISGAKVSATDELAASVRALLARSLEPMLRDGRKARVLEVESVGVSAELERQRRIAYRTFADAIDEAFAAFVRAGLTNEAPGGLTSLILVGGITEALVQRVQTPESERSERESFIDEIAAVILRLIT